MYSIKKNRDSPERLRIKTLNDEILTKAEMALLAINDYEMRRSRVIVPSSSFVLTEEENTKGGRSMMHISTSSEMVDIAENFDHKVCMLGSSVEYYKLDCRDKIFPIKIEFSQVKNCFRVFASFSHMFPSEESCEYDFAIERSTRKTIAPLAQRHNAEGFFLSLVAKNSIGMMSMRFSFYEKMLGEMKEQSDRASIRIRKLKDAESPSRTFSFLSRNNFKFREQTPETKVRYDKLRTAVSQERIPKARLATTRTNFLQKNIAEQTHYNELAFSRKVLRSERQSDRFRETRTRREQFWVQKEKERELREKAAANKKVIAIKKKKVEREKYEKQEITRDATTFLYLYKFLGMVHLKREAICERFRQSAQLSMYQNKFCRALKYSVRRIKQLLPQKRSRDMANAHSALYLLTRVDRHSTELRAGSMLTLFINSIQPSLRVNNSLDQATVFRRKLRLVQKHWRTKFNCRLKIIMMCGERQVYTLLDKFPKFSSVSAEFKSGNHLYKLCLQYVKETALKFNQMLMSYERRQEELYDITKLNEEIKKQNRNLPAKQHRPLFDVSNVPKQPHYRFFRDLDILRGMIRDWFEIECRKLEKKNRKPWDKQS